MVTVAAVAVNAAEVALAGTVTAEGTGSAPGLFDVSATERPPVGAAWFKLTVQVVTAPDATLVGLQTIEETATAGVTVTVAVAVPLSEAVTVADWDVATEPAVAVKVAEVAAAATVTDVGMGSAVALLDDSVTTLPPAGAA